MKWGADLVFFWGGGAGDRVDNDGDDSSSNTVFACACVCACAMEPETPCPEAFHVPCDAVSVADASLRGAPVEHGKAVGRIVCPCVSVRRCLTKVYPF